MIYLTNHAFAVSAACRSETVEHNDLVAVVASIVSAPRTGETADDLVLALKRSDKLRRLAQSTLQEAVTVARAQGSPWQRIGDTLGIGRQAAFTRFDARSSVLDGEASMSQPSVDLVERTENVFHSLSMGDYESVKALMTFTCSRMLPKKKVMGVWASVIGESGRFERCSHTVVQPMDGRDVVEKLVNQYAANYVVGQTQLHYEAGEWRGRVAFTGRGKITGVLIAAADAENLQF
jgi:hypothetical protein